MGDRRKLNLQASCSAAEFEDVGTQLSYNYSKDSGDSNIEEPYVRNRVRPSHNTRCPGVVRQELENVRWTSLQRSADHVAKVNVGVADINFRSEDSDSLALWEEKSENVEISRHWQKHAGLQSPWRESVGNAMKKFESISHAWAKSSPNHPKAGSMLGDNPRQLLESLKKAGGRSTWRDSKIVNPSVVKGTSKTVLQNSLRAHSSIGSPDRRIDRNVGIEYFPTAASSPDLFCYGVSCELQSPKSSEAGKPASFNQGRQADDKEEPSFGRDEHQGFRSDDLGTAFQIFAVEAERALSRQSAEKINLDAVASSMDKCNSSMVCFQSTDIAMLNECASEANGHHESGDPKARQSHFQKERSRERSSIDANDHVFQLKPPSGTRFMEDEGCIEAPVMAPIEKQGRVLFKWERELRKSKETDSDSATLSVQFHSALHLPPRLDAPRHPNHFPAHLSGDGKSTSPRSILCGPDDGSQPSSIPSLNSEREGSRISARIVISPFHSRSHSRASFDSVELSIEHAFEHFQSPESGLHSPLRGSIHCNSMANNHDFNHMRKYLSSNRRQEGAEEHGVNVFVKFCKNGKRWMKSKTISKRGMIYSPEVWLPSIEMRFQSCSNSDFSARLGGNSSPPPPMSTIHHGHVQAETRFVPSASTLLERDLGNRSPAYVPTLELLSPIQEFSSNTTTKELQMRPRVRTTRKSTTRVSMHKAIRNLFSRWTFQGPHNKLKVGENNPLYHLDYRPSQASSDSSRSKMENDARGSH